MIIRRARLDDAESCFELFLKDKEEYWTLENFRSSAINSAVIFLIAEKDNAIVGYIIGFFVPSRKSEVGLHETRVDRERRKQGIGSALVDEFVKYAFKGGATIVSASVEENILPFYRDACGFKRDGVWIEVVRGRE